MSQASTNTEMETDEFFKRWRKKKWIVLINFQFLSTEKCKMQNDDV